MKDKIPFSDIDFLSNITETYINNTTKLDGLYSHIAWLRTIKEKIKFNGMKNIEVKFPLIEDITMEVAKKYGMIQPGESKTQAVRAVFFIDPKRRHNGSCQQSTWRFWWHCGVCDRLL